MFGSICVSQEQIRVYSGHGFTETVQLKTGKTSPGLLQLSSFNEPVPNAASEQIPVPG